MNSMTGFGKSEINFKFGKFSIEISGVNNRFLEVSSRLPRQFFPFETKIRELISSSINRGKIKVFINFEESDNSPGKYLINEAAFNAYYKQLKKFKEKYKISGDITINDMMQLPDIAEPDKDSIDEKLYWTPLEKGLDKALSQLKKMRKSEGLAMKKDISNRLKMLSDDLSQIKKLTNNSVTKRREKLTNKINEILDSHAVDPSRLEEEIAIFSEKVDVTEECTRLESHFKLFNENLKFSKPIGKQLNFILQEMNRETNTIASKSYENQISSIIINMKHEIEKIRELVQNVE
ncbi:MAG: YicC/YloC family endoribonuclease [candidate division Zixibacteria bacterium]|nr:YicC/YloC family endoribonuclease [candidate division Zixibacteria bacterium]